MATTTVPQSQVEQRPPRRSNGQVTRAELAEHLRSLLLEVSGPSTDAVEQAVGALQRYDAEMLRRFG